MRASFLATPQTFLSSIDKRKIVSPMMFLTADGQTIFLPAMETRTITEKIYTLFTSNLRVFGVCLRDLGTVVNTKYDEDYPYMDADGETLYFSSRGHNSMGGYDMFKTTYDAFNDTWSGL